MTVTADEVVSAYRLVLGRDPESADVVAGHTQRHRDRRALLDSFLDSPEYRAKNGQSQAPRRRLWPPSPCEVDVEVTPAQLAACVARVQGAWEELGRHAPHWSVLTDERFRPDAIAGNLEAFYALGEGDAQAFLHALERYGDPMLATGRCLELGCGVGRVTKWLAKSFQQVTAVDISAPHLELARRYFAEQRIANAAFEHLQSLDSLAALPMVEAVFSVIVIQHNPPPVMARLLSGLLGRLKPGGIAFVQFPTHHEGYRFRVNDYLARAAASGEMEMHLLPQHDAFRVVADAGCRVLETYPDDYTGVTETREQVSSTFVIQRPRASR